MKNQRAIILFVRDEHDEALAKPLPRRYRAHGYGSINRSIAARLASITDEGIDFITATDCERESSAEAGRIRQRGSSFGERITHVLTDAFALGYRNVVVIGNDCPTISISDVLAAFHRLANGAGLVAAPARDGGAFLVGGSAAGFDPVRFAALPWQTARLCSALLALPGATALPVVRKDYDRWNGADAEHALRLLLGTSANDGLRVTRSRRPMHTGSAYKALTRIFLTSPPVR